jgi:polyhydroxybutyrate depolymerase
MKLIPGCLLMLLGLRATAQQNPLKTEEMIIDGMTRSFVSYIPPAAKMQKALPLIVSLHGGLASPKGQFRLADFRPLADKDHFIVVCPASKHIWHDGANDHGINDVRFIDSLITYMVNTYHADPSRVYVTGISNGGFMTSRLACQLHSRIAAIAVVAATLDSNEGYDLSAPMPVMYIHGTKDPIVDYKGGKVFGRPIFSHDQVIKKWITMDQCDPNPIVTTLPDSAHDGTSITKQVYRNANNELQVVSYTVTNGGHTWPGGWQFAPKFIVGKTTQNLNACDVIWDFFKAYHLNAP